MPNDSMPLVYVRQIPTSIRPLDDLQRAVLFHLQTPMTMQQLAWRCQTHPAKVVPALAFLLRHHLIRVTHVEPAQTHELPALLLSAPAPRQKPRSKLREVIYVIKHHYAAKRRRKHARNLRRLSGDQIQAA